MLDIITVLSAFNISVADSDGFCRLTLSELASRSQGVPLDVVVAMGEESWPVQRAHADQSALFSTFEREVHRMRKLYIDIGAGRPSIFGRLLCEFFQSDLSTCSWSAPLLEDLTLETNNADGDSRILFHRVLLKLKALSLRSLDVYGFTFSKIRGHIDYEALTRLILRGCTVRSTLHNFIAPLGWFPQLEYLAIQHLDCHLCPSRSIITTRIPPQHLISLPRLKTMEIDCQSRELSFLSSFMHHITIPRSATVIILVEFYSLRASASMKLEEIAVRIGVSLGDVPTRVSDQSIIYVMSADQTRSMRKTGDISDLPAGLLLL